VTLTLQITHSSQPNARDARSHVFSESGGSIGRAAGNSWVLTPQSVSGLHAQITFRNGAFYIEELGRNGVSVNTPENRLGKGRRYALKAGDRLFIEPYTIDVWVDDTAERRTRSAPLDPFADDDPFAPRPVQQVSVTNPDPLPPSDHDVVDPLPFFAPVGGRQARKPDPVVVSDDLLNQHYRPPDIVGPPPAPPSREPDPISMPQDYNPLSDDPIAAAPVLPPPRPAAPAPPPPPPLPEPPLQEPPTPPIRPRPGDSEARRKLREMQTGDATVRQSIPTPPVNAGLAAGAAIPQPPPAPRPAEVAPRQPSHTADLAQLLIGAGVPDAVITPELSKNLGEILQIVVSGLMDVLKSRQRIKEEFGMHQTMFRPVENNPLKFSANLEDALHNLLVKRNPAYLPPVEAFAEAFDDLRDHQLAMLEGMRVAFESMLTEFDADRLQQEFDGQAPKGSLQLMPAKMRYWEMYREKRQDQAKDPEKTFARLFGEEFSRAYEEQFRKLKAARRTRGRGSPDGSAPVK